MKNQRLSLALSLLIGSALGIEARAERSYVYNGVLAKAAGLPAPDGTYAVAFSIYATRENGSVLWQESEDAIRIQDGQYSVTLGKRVPLDLPDGEYWLEIRINGETLAPRSSLQLNPSTRADCAIDGNLFVSGSVGIGTAPTSRPLTVQGEIATGYTGIYFGGAQGDFYFGVGARLTDSLVYDTFGQHIWRIGEAEVMRMDYGGDVGLGSTDPTAKLEVVTIKPNDSAIRAVNNSIGNGAYGVYGFAGVGYGVYGQSTAGIGTVGSSSTSTGVYGSSGSGYGVYGASTDSFAGYFSGNVHVNGTLTKSGGAFKIDHPLDPANKVLYHSFVESPDMKNIYDGVAVLDRRGEATVRLPEWFGALNRDFRYQLTCIGAHAPVFIAEEVTDNLFKIAGGDPGLKVSWQVTGIRQDAYANAHRLPVEEDKPESEQGHYLNPEVFGVPREKRVDWLKSPESAVSQPRRP